MRRSLNYTIAAASMLMLGSCTGVSKHPPTMGADPALTGAEGIALTNQLQSAFVVVASTDKNKLCEFTQPQHHEKESLSYRRYANNSGLPPKHLECIQYLSNPTAEQIASHIDAGFALSDLYCDTFFRRISQHRNQRRYARNVFNDVGAAVSAVLGLASAGSAATGAAGAAFGLVDGSFRNYDDAFLVSADLSTLQNKVYDEQSKFRATMTAGKLKRYSEANSAILRYANYCSYNGMQGLINASLTETTDPAAAFSRMTATIKAYMKMATDVAAAKSGEEVIDNAVSLDNSQ